MAPYQIFFPIGFLSAILAVGIWFTQNLGWFNTPVILIHSKLIMGGFLWSFIVGFLMTAIPKMTGTIKAHKFELTAALFVISSLIFFSWKIDARYFYASQILLVIFLLFFGGRRILRMTKPIPVFISHVGMAMLLALVGAVFHFQGNSIMGIHLYHVGAILLLVLGIGTRFFSFISGLPSVFEETTAPWRRRIFHGLGILTGFLLFFAGRGHKSAYLALGIVSLVYLFGVWKVQRPSNRPSALKYGVRIVALMIPISFFLSWIQPHMFITWIHLLFIGCFGLITFAVATRVTLAHGSYPIVLETTSRALWWLVIFMTLGLISRIMYGFTEGISRVSFLHLAATFWIFAIVSWGWTFFLKILKPGNQSKPSC